MEGQQYQSVTKSESLSYTFIAIEFVLYIFERCSSIKGSRAWETLP